MHTIGGNIIRVLFLCFAGTTVALARSADPVDQLRACAKTADRDARIECYEVLGRQVLDADANTETVTQSTEPAQPGPAAAVELAGTPALRDDLGGKQFSKETATTGAVNRGLITSCSKGPVDRWYFYFENGQVWKQANSGRLYFDDCKRFATITKDLFGYKMKLDGRKGKIRITRTR